MRATEITEENIKQLVDLFYARIRQDAELGPIFDVAIGTDDQSWSLHLHRMYDFWSSILLTSGRYHGNPLQKHRDLPPFNLNLFDRWLELFTDTVREIYTPIAAENFITKSQRIADSLRLGLASGKRT
ncbi:group III truncated hemoglobin [Emcibacter sp.]|uniref:group III truncated hemoglobin n=1 Tax=Emcibacter sp. TaxID=1979954 RepID=UPI003A8E4556